MKQDSEGGYREDSGEFDHQKILYTILERKWTVLGCLAAALLLAGLYVATTPKTFSATTVLQVEQQESKVLNKIEDITAQDLKQAEVLKTIESNLASPNLLLGVIQSLGLKATDLGLKPKSDGSAYSDNELVEVISRKVSTKLIRGTRLINVKADSTNPTRAQEIADQVVKEYQKLNEAQRAGVSNEASIFLVQEAERLKKQLELAEGEAQAFKDAHPNTALENSMEFIDQKLLGLNQKLNETKEMRFRVESDHNQAQKIMSGGTTPEKTNQLMTIQSVNTDLGVLQFQKSVSDAEAYLRQLAERYRPKHPAYIQQQAQVASLKTNLNNAIIQAAGAIGTQLETARQMEKNFDADLKLMERSKLDNEKLAIPYAALQREVEANRQLYEGVKMRLKETEVTSAIGFNEVRVVTPARLPLKPSKPNTMLILMGAVVCGLGAGLGICFAQSMMDKSIRTVDAAELALGLPAVAAVPLVEKVEKGKRFLITQDPNGMVAEAFRTLRTSLSLEIGSDAKTILFTSSIPGEGKSFCAMNYAISLAQLGQKTLLIDGDLRLPMVGKTLFEKDDGNGIQTLLIGQSDLENSVKPLVEVPNLFVLASGVRRSNPAEVLAGSAFGELIKEAESKYDRIVIDSAPVHAVSDTLLLIKHAHTVCFVIHAGRTPEKAVKRAVQILENAGSRPAGIVLNRVSQQGGGYYYSYSGGKYGDNVYGSTAEKT